MWELTLKQMAVNAYAATLGIPEVTLESGWRSTDRAARVRAHGGDWSQVVAERVERARMDV